MKEKARDHKRAWHTESKCNGSEQKRNRSGVRSMRLDFYKYFFLAFADALDGVTFGVLTRFVVPRGEDEPPGQGSSET
jgi:hypothetical protein